MAGTLGRTEIKNALSFFFYTNLTNSISKIASRGKKSAEVVKRNR
jgi:hypothetical protein